jgi:hypothetical protein
MAAKELAMRIASFMMKSVFEVWEYLETKGLYQERRLV